MAALAFAPSGWGSSTVSTGPDQVSLDACQAIRCRTVFDDPLDTTRCGTPLTFATEAPTPVSGNCLTGDQLPSRCRTTWLSIPSLPSRPTRLTMCSSPLTATIP